MTDLGHPAALVLADHYIARTNPVRTPTAPIGCACGWTGPSCDHPAHLTEVLQQAGLLRLVAPGDVMAVVVEDQPPADRGRATLLAECRYCGQGWLFSAGTRQGPQEVILHEAGCTGVRADRRTT